MIEAAKFPLCEPSAEFGSIGLIIYERIPGSVGYFDGPVSLTYLSVLSRNRQKLPPVGASAP